MKLRTWVAALSIAYLASSAPAVELYNGTLGTLPGSQGWLKLQSLQGIPVETLGPTSTTFDTTAASSIYSGYFNYNLLTPVNPAFPVLSRTDGFVVSVDMRVISETHDNNNRAGVSLIALASDSIGLEVGFWQNEVWVQSGPDFQHAEGAAFNTTSAITRYELIVRGGGYRIDADGNQILSGNVRDYRPFGLPYTLPNFIFFGDDTSSARGSFEISRLAVVPEPQFVLAAALLLSLGMMRIRA